MSLFALCDYEGEVQVADKTRYDASKTFVAKGNSALTTLTIKPGADGSSLSVFDASDSSNHYLDWCFASFAIDVDSTNNDVAFTEGGTAKTGTIASGTYTLSQYATALAAAMTIGGTQTYSGSTSAGKLVISAPTKAWQFTDSSAETQGFFNVQTAGFDDIAHGEALSNTGNLVEYGLRKVVITAGDGTNTSSFTIYQKIYSSIGDALWNDDTDVIAHEPDLMKYVAPGRSSFLNVYRRAQVLILQWLDEQGYCDVYQHKYTKFDVLDTEGVREWSTFLSLKLIMDGLKNQVDDIFQMKGKNYEVLAAVARNRAILRLDTNKDGVLDVTEGVSIQSLTLYRR